MSLQSVSLADDDKRVTEVKTDEKERVDCPSDRVYLRIDADFTGKKDEALFSYSLDNVTWHRIGTPCRMISTTVASSWAASLPSSTMPPVRSGAMWTWIPSCWKPCN